MKKISLFCLVLVFGHFFAFIFPHKVMAQVCQCPHSCLPGVGGCHVDSGLPNTCPMECCTLGACPSSTSNPPSSGDFSSWIDVATPNFSSGTTVGAIVYTLIPYILGLAGFAVLIYVVLGGYQIMISQGDPKQLAAGREKITYAIVGFIIMFSAYWITRLAAEILDLAKVRQIFGG